MSALDIYKMDLHQIERVKTGKREYEILRVHNGWIYTMIDTLYAPVFVPETDLFKKTDSVYGKLLG